MISPGSVGFDINCGVQLLVSELDREKLAPHKHLLADTLYKCIPSGVGSSRRDVELCRKDVEEILVGGVASLVKRGYEVPGDLDHIESRGRFPDADPECVSTRAYERGGSQLGTLGSGNHFLEVGSVLKSIV